MGFRPAGHSVFFLARPQGRGTLLSMGRIRKRLLKWRGLWSVGNANVREMLGDDYRRVSINGKPRPELVPQ